MAISMRNGRIVAPLMAIGYINQHHEIFCSKICQGGQGVMASVGPSLGVGERPGQPSRL